MSDSPDTASASGDNALRQAMLQAGEQLLTGPKGVDGCSVDALVRETGASKQDFRKVFGDRDRFLLELLHYLLDELRDEALQAVGNMPAGIERMWRAVEAYLDGNLRHPALRVLGNQLIGNAEAAKMLRGRVNAFSMLIKLELGGMGKANAAAAGRLSTAMALEVVQAEHNARRALPEMRRALYAFLSHY